MRWLILKTTAAIAAAFIGVGLILYQQYSLKESFQNSERTGGLLSSVQTELIELQRTVLQASFFPYFDNDEILVRIKKIKSDLQKLANDPSLHENAYALTLQELKSITEEFGRLTSTLYRFLTLNASLKNSAVYLPTLALKAYSIFDPSNDKDRRAVTTLAKLNATIFLTKNALDESFLKEIEQYRDMLQNMAPSFTKKEKRRVIDTTIGHLNLFLKTFPQFHADLKTILDDSLPHRFEEVTRAFLEESRKRLEHINTLGNLLLLLYLITLLIVLYFIFRFEKENIKLKIVRDQLQRSLVTDHLTGLENREAYLMEKKRMKHPALILVNIDRFKHINEFYGSKIGDMVLQQSAQKLKEIVPIYLEAHLYRLGGDDFGILYEFKSRERTEKVIKKILKHFHEKTLDIEGIAIDISISIGASYAKKLLETADMALKHTKASKRGRYTIYDRSIDISEKISKNIKALKQLKRAISKNNIIPYFQPIVDLGSGTVAKYEALARMRTQNGTVLEPSHFLDAAREAKLSGEITAAILRQTLDIAKKSDMIFSVNISAGDIMNSHDRETIFTLLGSHEECARRILFEIVESEEIEDYETLGEFIERIRGFGCQIAIDDFGSGYSNFEKLLQLKVDILKIDGSLIREIDSTEHTELIVRTISDFAKAAGLKTVAEYVHSESILKKVKELEIDFAQGYFLGKPVPVPQTAKRRGNEP